MYRLLKRRNSMAVTCLLVVTLLLLCLNIILFINSEDQEQERMEDDDSEMKAPPEPSYVYSWPKCQMNESATKIQGFNLLSDRDKNFLYYFHCRHFPMLLDIPNKCRGAEGSANIFLLLVIKSSPANYINREVLRKTWAKERLYNGVWIKRIFISGTTANGFERERLNELVKLEQQEYNDMLQWGFDESLFNLTLKQILFLEWMERNCPQARFLLNGDDDVFANTDSLVEYLQGLKDNNGNKHLFTGDLFMNAKPIRSPESKYFIPLQVFSSDKYPPYCGGGGIIMSGYTALVIYKMSLSIALFPIDDVYLAMCLKKAGLAPDSHMAVRTLGWYIPSSKIDQYDPCYFKEHLLLHRLQPLEIYRLWHKIHEPGLKCGKKNCMCEEAF